MALKKDTGLNIKKLEERHYVEPRGVPDTLGAYVALSGIKDSLTLFHGTAGCGLNIRAMMVYETYDEREFSTTGMDEQMTIFGGEERLRAAIEKAAKGFSPAIIGVIGGTVASLIGDDASGIVETERSRLAEDNISIVYAPTSYLKGDKMTGYNLILEALVDNVVEEPAQNMSRTVNIFGIMADMSNANADALEMKRLLGELGIKVNEVFCCNSEIDRIKHAAEANLNIVVSEIRGVGAAQKMEQRFGIPYRVVPYPIGMTNTKNFLQTAADFFRINKKKVDELIARESETVYEAMRKAMFWAAEYRGCALVGSMAAIVGESTAALGVTRYLIEEWGVKPLLLVLKTYNEESLELLSEMQKELGIKPQVLLNPSHDDIRQAFRETKPALILGGNYEKADVRETGLDRSAGTVFIHIATFPCGVDTAGRFDIYPHPFAGFQGVIYLTEVILNEMVRQSFEQVWAAFPATPSTTS